MIASILSTIWFLANSPHNNAALPNSVVFAEIYDKGHWGKDNNGKGTSGLGSSLENAKDYLQFLTQFLKSNKITSVVDLGCGDWQFSRTINWDGIQYTGIDVVKELIKKNTEQFAKKNIVFINADGIDYELPAADLLICKEVLQHLPFMDIEAIVAQFHKFKYCLIINDVDPITLTCVNNDIPRGGYGLLDLTQPPFYTISKK